MDLLLRLRLLSRPVRLVALLALLTLPFTSVGCSSAPAANGTTHSGVEKQPARYQVPESLDAELPVDPRVRVGHLDNGLTYYLRRNASPEDRAELWLVVNAGSILEDEDQRGLAHFVEHMAFNGTRHFARQELVSYLESIGMRFGPDINAYTSFDETVYLLQVPTDHEGYLERGHRDPRGLGARHHLRPEGGRPGARACWSRSGGSAAAPSAG